MSKISTKGFGSKLRQEYFSALATLWFLPALVSAQAPQNFTQLANKWIDLINIVVSWLMILCGVVFMNGFIFYFAGGGDQEKVAEGKKRMYFGFLGLFILFSWYGISKLLKVSIFG